MEKTTMDLVDRTFGEGGLLAGNIPNYTVRPQQVELSKQIKESMEQEQPLVAEAPTGVGKSLAALVPAFEHIKQTDEPVVVVTSSIILQEQYINKDIPLLEKLYDFQVNPVLIKGRNNYVCAKKLSDAKNDQVSFNRSDQLKEFSEVKGWAAQTKTGDKSELEFVPSFPVWASLACVDDNECTGKQCPLYNVCHYYRERNKVNTSKLVVCNYHYFFSSINSEANMLPGGTKVIVMDEGHEVSGIARDFQERKYSVNTLKRHFDHFAKMMERAKPTEIGPTIDDLFYDMDLNEVNGSLTTMIVGLTHEYKKVVTAIYTRDFWQLEVPERTRMQKYATEHIKKLDEAADAAQRYLDKFGFSMEDLAVMSEMFEEEAVDWFVAVHNLMNKLDELSALLHYVFAYDEDQYEGEDIFWLQPFQEGVSIHVKPTTGAGLTRKLFVREEKEGEGYVPILMSATLSANKSFHHLKEELGIAEAKQVNELIVPSPFDLTNNVLWYLPPDTPAGNDPGHQDFMLGEMKRIIEAVNGRALCLFTSRKNLQQAEVYLSGVLPEHIQIVSQERMPKQKIINYMKENDHTVILGTRSFFTGIDVPGHHLSAVLIDKLPFPMIGDPINDYLMSQPRGFHKYSLPEAIISLKQGFGRLNRSSEDKGIVSILDGRLATARYKNKIFNSFDFQIRATTNWEDVLHYIREAGLS